MWTPPMVSCAYFKIRSGLVQHEMVAEVEALPYDHCKHVQLGVRWVECFLHLGHAEVFHDTVKGL